MTDAIRLIFDFFGGLLEVIGAPGPTRRRKGIEADIALLAQIEAHPSLAATQAPVVLKVRIVRNVETLSDVSPRRVRIGIIANVALAAALGFVAYKVWHYGWYYGVLAIIVAISAFGQAVENPDLPAAETNAAPLTEAAKGTEDAQTS